MNSFRLFIYTFSLVLIIFFTSSCTGGTSIPIIFEVFIDGNTKNVIREIRFFSKSEGLIEDNRSETSSNMIGQGVIFLIFSSNNGNKRITMVIENISIKNGLFVRFAVLEPCHICEKFKNKILSKFKFKYIDKRSHVGCGGEEIMSFTYTYQIKSCSDVKKSSNNRKINLQNVGNIIKRVGV